MIEAGGLAAADAVIGTGMGAMPGWRNAGCVPAVLVAISW